MKIHPQTQSFHYLTQRRVVALIVGKQQWEQHMEQVQAMRSCNLSHSDVFSCGDHQWLQQRLVDLNELILSNTLITSWGNVAAIIRALPALETLDLSGNSLQLSEADRCERQPALSHTLVQIILNSTASVHMHFTVLCWLTFTLSGDVLVGRAVPALSVSGPQAPAPQSQPHQLHANK
jgi:hypothetical protein